MFLGGDRSTVTFKQRLPSSNKSVAASPIMAYTACTSILHSASASALLFERLSDASCPGASATYIIMLA